MIKLWQVAVFAMALVGFLVVRAPASLIVRPSPSFTYAEAEGTIWQARFSGARIAGLNAGVMSADVSAMGLVQGKLDMPFSVSGADLEGRGRILANLEGDRRIVIAHAVLNSAPMGTIVLSGKTEFRDLDIFFRNGRCSMAQGAASSDVLQRNAAVFGGAAPILTGQAACVGDHAEITMSGSEAGRSYLVTLVLRGDGAGEARAVVGPTPAEVLATLGSMGFSPDPATGGALLRRDFRWLPH